MQVCERVTHAYGEQLGSTVFERPGSILQSTDECQNGFGFGQQRGASRRQVATVG